MTRTALSLSETTLVIIFGMLMSLFMVIILSFCGFTVQGDHQTNEIEDYNHYNMPYTNHWARLPNETWVHAYAAQDHRLNVSWSIDEGSSWTEEEVIGTAWKGHTYLSCFGVVTSSNNTTIVLFRTENADSIHDNYLAILWPGAGTWLVRSIYTSGTYVWDHCDMVINRTDEVTIIGYHNQAGRYKTYDPSTDTVSPAGNPTWFVTLINGRFSLACDQYNDVWIAWRTSSNLYVYDIDKTVTLSWSPYGSGLGGYPDIVICENNRKMVSASYVFGLIEQVDIYYESTVNTTFTKRTLVTGTDDYLEAWMGLSVTSANVVYVTCYNRETGSEQVEQWHASWNAPEATWQASKRTIYPLPTASDLVYTQAGATHVWPKVDGTSACIPTSGYLHTWMFRDELGATDDHYHSVNWSGSWPSFYFGPPVEITTHSLPRGTYNVFYQKTLAAIYGQTPYSWSILVAPAWLNVGSSNGTLYGTPTGTGTFTVRVRVTDAGADTDTEEWNLTIRPYIPPDTSEGEDWGGFTDDFIAYLWWAFIVLCVTSGIMATVLNVEDHAEDEVKDLARDEMKRRKKEAKARRRKEREEFKRKRPGWVMRNT